MTETTAAASALRAVLDPPPPPSDAHLAGAVASLTALRSLLESRRTVSSRVAQLSAAVEAAGRDTARRVEGVDGRVVEVKLASVLAMEERDQVAHELAALERQLAATEEGSASKGRRRRWGASAPYGQKTGAAGADEGARDGSGEDEDMGAQLDHQAESTMRLLADIEKELLAATEDVTSISASRTAWRRRQASESTSSQRA
ncbi:hypothetical protein BU14_0094s0030 [Porphyra umbilicalis]|uniref:Uncharacterized protein n=1 Tax=Porphyra umbilicalis TaxID=2786 RepID=A0A1X6PE90_PORUM|nr:hypothetical protein BU14_0094s0030 [Porphyra umbilicalis]|eukprot:OSX78953.1 hypothetical protein BU14_0094s0030 [Porphyra umbilicalis]